VHVLDQAARGPKPALVSALGATYHTGCLDQAIAGGRPDIVIEATGAADLVIESITATAPFGIVCLIGLTSSGRRITIDAGTLNRVMVLENEVVVGSINSVPRHYVTAAAALAQADSDWLARLVTRRVPLSRFADAFDQQEDDVKVVITL
jgi:threonine dehydrogenase-like Zn-dependent dehydrogenase